MVPHYYNTSRSRNTYRVRGKWENYRSGHGWNRIVSDFKNDGSAFEFSAGPFRFHCPQFANGTATMEVNNEWDIFGKRGITSSPMVFEVTPEDILPVAGRIDENNPSQVWYDDAYGDALASETFTYNQITNVSGNGNAFEADSGTATADGSGLVQIAMYKGASYRIIRGSGEAITISIDSGASSTTELGNMLI